MDNNVTTAWLITFLAVGLWELVWKGLALWKASQRDHRAWFIALLVINSAGILPILYLFIYRNKEKQI